MTSRADEGRLSPVPRALLCDLDGTLYVGDEPVPGAPEAVDRLRGAGIAMRFVTNTTLRSVGLLHEKLRLIGLPVARVEILSAVGAAVLHLRSMGSPSCHLAIADAAKEDFAEFRQNDERPDVVVVGDIGSAWTFDIMQRLFRMLTGGASLVALHKGRAYESTDGLTLDVGAFVAGLEYAAGVEATVVGKPSGAFFHLALEDLGVAADHAAMIGDDVRSDVGGAQAAGMRGILVRTGKYREADAAASGVVPDLTIDSIADLPRALGLS
jgi:HAD superfamily hydrolase (TIGR01458 family)